MVDYIGKKIREKYAGPISASESYRLVGFDGWDGMRNKMFGAEGRI